MAFWDFDFSAIEARVVCWVGGQEDALEEYRQGTDRYKRMASVIYGVPEEQVSKFPQRFVGKQAVLLCGFQGGAVKFRTTCKKMGGYDLPEGLEDTAVAAWRKKHPKVVKSWYDVEDAAKRAIVKRGDVFEAAKCKFTCRDIAGTLFLLIKLPSGRKLAYPRPKISPHRKFEGKTAITFFGNIKGTTWGSVDTYGGKLVENITQAVAADIMANGAHNLEREGYEIATLIHDQCLAYVKPGQTAERFMELLTDLPPWASGLPIAAEGGLVPYYKKD